MQHLLCSLTILAQTATQQPRVADEPSVVSPWLMACVVLVVLGLPFLLGSLIARWLKMKDLGMRIGVVLLAFVLGMSNFAWQYLIGYLEHRKYDQDIAVWQKRQEARESIKPGTLEELKKASPKLDVRFEDQRPAVKAQ